MKTYFVILLAICSSTIYAQLGDCSGALLLESKEDVSFLFSEEDNQLSDLLNPLCIDANNSYIEDGGQLTHWFTWKIKESGSLYFTLSKQAEDYDLDFILYKSASNGDPCANKEAIRCMYAGQTIGAPSEPCLMATGLSPYDTDLFENRGCTNGNNSFLQQIDALAGEEYRLLVLNFNLSEGENTLLELCGTATLGETDLPCFTLDTDELIEEKRVSIFPNPSNDQLFLSNNNVPTVINFPFIIMDQMGRVVMRKDDNNNLESIDIHALQSGIYFININNGGDRKILKFVKQ